MISKNTEVAGVFPPVMMILFLLFFLPLYFVPSYFLFKSSNGAKKIKNGEIMNGMDETVKYMSKFWTFVGIVTAIFIGIYAIVGIPLLIIGLVSAIT